MVRIGRITAVLVALVVAASCPGQGREQRFESMRGVMGVRAVITVYATDRDRATAAMDAAFARIEALDRVMSDYRADSEVARVAAAAGTGPIPISEDLADVLHRSLELAEASGGAFDPTVGSMVRLWRDARRSGQLPDPQLLERARQSVGWQRVRLDRERRTVELEAGVSLDFGGIGKGYAAQAAVDLLRSLDHPSCLVSIGGDIVAGDAPRHHLPWTVDIEGLACLPDPVKIKLVNAAVAVSGDIEQFVEVGGVRYSHIVDPATGIGLTTRAAVAILAPDGALADGLATAASVLARTNCTDLLERFGARALVEWSDGERKGLSVAGNFPVRPDDLAAPSADDPIPPGFRALFNGRDLEGWCGLAADPPARARLSPHELAEAQFAADDRMRAHWTVQDGELVFNGLGENLCTRDHFADFELLLDWKIAPDGDSGVYLRGVPQVQIWDRPDGSGGLYNNQVSSSRPLHRADRAPGQWNRFRIRMVDRSVTVYLNGDLVVDNVELENYWDRSSPVPATGPIELQAHGSPLRFRRLCIREIAPE